MLKPYEHMLAPDSFPKTFPISLFQPHGLVAHKDPDTLSWSKAMANTEHLDK
jgi:hypothetical protein